MNCLVLVSFGSRDLLFPFLDESRFVLSFSFAFAFCLSFSFRLFSSLSSLPTSFFFGSSLIIF